ncbi:hypothetical protein [Niveibacterium sp. SC-1]|uniref:hypothetical protein n=1 Tax=Niveibacterium sp. SC-1 TaxID=3135646 RepID=UPI00311DFEA5
MKSSRIASWRHLAFSILGILACSGAPDAGAAQTKKTAAQTASTSTQAKSGKSAPAKQGTSGSKSGAKTKTGNPKATAGSKAATKSSGGGSGSAKACYKTTVQKGRKQRVKVPCGPAPEPVLNQSPINEKALQQSGEPLPNSPVKARSAPIRAYAVDGATFYQNGRKFRIEGLGDQAGMSNEREANKLQQILDSGLVTTEPIGNDESGAMRAVVKVDGRDISELMRMRP